MRLEFEMTEAQLVTLMHACQPYAMIALQCGTPSSPQENANRAWQHLADEMGFVWDTVQPTRKGNRFFTAETKEVAA